MPSPYVWNNEAHAVRLIELARSRGLLRSADATAQGIPRVYLQRLVEAGELEKVARGLYRLADGELGDAHHGLAVVALKAPRAVVSLLSALAFHGMTTHVPPQVWITLPIHAHAPRLDWPGIRVVHASEPTLSAGVEQHAVDGQPVRIYSPAKTVADCFKFRNKIGLDVALEALRAFRDERRGTLDELERMAKICRVSRVMRPYLEALAS